MGNKVLKVIFNVDDEMMEMLKDKAWRRKMTVSRYLRWLIETDRIDVS